MDEWFSNCYTLEEARVEYRRLCFEYHPDHGGDTAIMQKINAAYDRIRQRLEPLQAPRGTAYAGRSAAAHHWHAPPPRSTYNHSTEAEPQHPREAFQRVWQRTPWQAVPDVGFSRRVWGHNVTIFQHNAAKFQGAWFVLLDNVISHYFYFSRQEAEQAAFELVYEQVKHQAL